VTNSNNNTTKHGISRILEWPCLPAQHQGYKAVMEQRVEAVIELITVHNKRIPMSIANYLAHCIWAMRGNEGERGRFIDQALNHSGEMATDQVLPSIGSWVLKKSCPPCAGCGATIPTVHSSTFDGKQYWVYDEAQVRAAALVWECGNGHVNRSAVDSGGRFII
jgi:hypothetical protein